MPMFLEFIDALAAEMKRELPGWEAQKRMISGRPYMDMELINSKNPKQSGVLVWLYPENDEVFTRLILRTAYNGVHSAQVGFPGGTKEEKDANLWETAVREAHEEVGIIPGQIKYVGALTPLYIPPSNFWVEPFIAMSEHAMTAKIQAEEVQHTIDFNVRLLLDPIIKGEKEIVRSGTTLKMKTPFYDIGGHTVWGATAMMLSEMEELLRRVDEKLGK